MNETLRIAIYSGDIPSTTFIERLILGLSEKNCEILLFGRKKKSIAYKTNISVKGYKSGRVQKGFYLLYYALLLFLFKNKDKRKLDKRLKLEENYTMYDRVKYYPVLWHKPDIFHVQWAKGLSDWIWVQDFGIKLVLSLRGAHINYSPYADNKLAEMYRQYFPKVDKFHAVSKAIALEAQKYGADKDKIKVIYSGLDLNVFENTTTKPSENQSKFNVLSIGRPHWKKGYDYALDAFKLLKDKGFQFTYTIVGGINLEIKYQIIDLGLQDNVSVIEKLPFDEVKTLIKSSDLFLLPSVEEGIANVVLEAMAMKKLVLTTNCGGMEESITDNVNGFVVPVRNPKAIANKIIEISQISEHHKAEMVNNAFEVIKKQHTKETMVSGMLNLYTSL